MAETCLRPLKEAGVDTLILGCTHYPLMSHVIARVMGPEVKLISSAEETAREAQNILQKLGLQQIKTAAGPRHRFFVSGPPAGFVRIGRKLLEREIEAYQVILP